MELSGRELYEYLVKLFSDLPDAARLDPFSMAEEMYDELKASGHKIYRVCVDE